MFATYNNWKCEQLISFFFILEFDFLHHKLTFGEFLAQKALDLSLKYQLKKKFNISLDNTCVTGLGVFNSKKCVRCPQNCITCSRNQDPLGLDTRMSCDDCDPGYLKLLIVADQPNLYGCILAENCEPSKYIQIQLFYYNRLLAINLMFLEVHFLSNIIQKIKLQFNYIGCSQCNPKSSYSQKDFKCELNSQGSKGCVFYNKNFDKCIACRAGYAVKDDICSPIICDGSCQTCLDNYPWICINYFIKPTLQPVMLQLEYLLMVLQNQLFYLSIKFLFFNSSN